VLRCSSGTEPADGAVPHFGTPDLPHEQRPIIAAIRKHFKSISLGLRGIVLFVFLHNTARQERERPSPQPTAGSLGLRIEI
jgi:hypothetical protein